MKFGLLYTFRYTLTFRDTLFYKLRPSRFGSVVAHSDPEKRGLTLEFESGSYQRLKK